MGAAGSAGVWVYLQHPFSGSDTPNTESESHSVVFDSLWPHRLYNPWNSLGQNTAVGSLSLFQGIFPTQVSNPDLLLCGLILYQLSHKGSPQLIINFQVLDLVGFPGCASGKETTCQARRLKRCGFNHWVREIPCRRAQQPTAVFLPWESHGQRSLVGYIQGSQRTRHDWSNLANVHALDFIVNDHYYLNNYLAVYWTDLNHDVQALAFVVVVCCLWIMQISYMVLTPNDQ